MLAEAVLAEAVLPAVVVPAVPPTETALLFPVRRRNHPRRRRRRRRRRPLSALRRLGWAGT